MQNFNGMNQSSANFNQNVYGGYPVGYPPMVCQPVGIGGVYLPPGYGNAVPGPYDSQYSPFINPQPQQQAQAPMVTPWNYVPGRSGSVSLEDSNGNSVKVPTNPQYNPGGATISQGGFNPVTGNTMTPMGGAGFNPYNQFIGNPGYQAQPQQSPYVGYNGYGNLNSAGYMQPYGYGYMNGYAQNQFDTQLQEFLYKEETSGFDVRAMLENVVLSEEERAKIDRNRNYNMPIGTDYYGRPIYSQTAYQANQQRQNEFEEARRRVQDHFVMLSKIAHAYSGEEVDEESVRRHFDPCPPRPQPKQFNYYTATPEEKKEYEREMRLVQTNDIIARMNYFEQLEQQAVIKKAQAFQMIKDSHDRMIGVEPGTHYDLKTFMDNGYKIGINIEMQKARSANRNGTTKYSRNDFRASLARHSNSPVPITSKDNEYISIEDMLKNIYDRNRAANGIMQMEDGQNTFTTMPVNSNSVEDVAHMKFMEAMQHKKNIDDARRAVM